jgi:hypothetical protein
VQRAVLLATRDETGRPDLAPLVHVLDDRVRARVRAAGPFDVTDAGLGAVARRERVPDAVIVRATGARAVVRATMHMDGDDDGEVRVKMSVRPAGAGGAGAGRATLVEARVPVAKGKSVTALADSLAVPLARAVAAALGDPR